MTWGVHGVVIDASTLVDVGGGVVLVIMISGGLSVGGTHLEAIVVAECIGKSTVGSIP